MTRACLIIPPSPFLLDERVFPSLGILRVASSLEKQGVDVDVLDLSGVSNYLDVVASYCRENDTVHFGITSTTPQYPAVHSIAGVLYDSRQDDDRLRVAIGGPHPTLVCAAAKAERKAGRVGRASRALQKMGGDFSAIIAGDGERIPFSEIFSRHPYPAVNVVDADDPSGPYFMTDAQYEDAPKEARHLIDLDSYHYSIEGHRATTLIAQLGCPFSCGFCGGRKSPMLRRIRNRSVDSILREVESLYKEYGYTGFMFYDDEMNVSKSMIDLMDGLYDLQTSLSTEFRLRGFVKAELFDERQASAMHRAGFRWLLTGFESGSPRILENIRKKATRDDNTRAVQIAKSNGLKVKALMSIGHPGESAQTIEDTKSWLLEVRPDDFDCTIITTYPGTPYYDDAVQTSSGIWTYTAANGDRLHADELDYTTTADYYKGAPGGGYRAYVHTDHLSSDDLVSLRDRLEDSVRTELGIPFNQSAASINYEHSMGQGIPPSIMRRSPKRARGKIHLPVV